MIGNLLRISPSQLKALQQDPGGIETVLYPDNDDETENERHLDLDKSWHIIHFLLAGDAWGGTPPFANAICGGAELGDVDVGYGPARYLTPAQVQEVGSALSGLAAKDLWSRFDAAAASRAEIYPADSWTNEDGEYVEDYYEKLRAFYAAAAHNSEAILLWIN
ncbi:MAG TPA: YfbM family protein [Steroidobacteraceae bacterium]